MNVKNAFLISSILSLVIVLAAMFMMSDGSTKSIVEGIFKGLAGVFFILFFIFMLLGKQPLDKTTH
jgi:hypothetical protein